MRRTREWWARLTKDERSYLVYLERADKRYGSTYNLPDGYSSCTACSEPCSGGGLCTWCGNEVEALIAKGNGEER